MEYTQQQRIDLVIAQAKRDSFTEREIEFYNEFLAWAGIKDVSTMTEQDADNLLKSLSASDCSGEFITNVVNYIAIHAPRHVLGHVLYSDRDGDGIPLIDELKLGRHPFVYEQPQLLQTKQSQHRKTQDIEL
ncbi:MAG: hypothetical protein KME30_25210 [Iphinoe sp. HA4291-MV1]|jgi:hypothetical protein|nr:hypothetical protein [Iphinoe sp. HA4291-MV1]